MIIANYHCHSHFSDGQGTPLDYVMMALPMKLASCGFSDHAPIPDRNESSMPVKALERYGNVIDFLKSSYGNRLDIYKGLEVDYIPNVISTQSEHILEAELDYTIGAVHYVERFNDNKLFGFESSQSIVERGINDIFGSNVKDFVVRYFELIREMLDKSDPTIVAHLDRIKKINTWRPFFDESDLWYRDQIDLTLRKIADHGVIMEVNTKGYYKNQISETYPSRWILERSNELNIPVHLASDAHQPQDVISGFRHGIHTLRAAGYREMTIMLDGIWQPVALLRPRMHVT
ncbi:MAG: histidinol-phosphatase [Saprospiraceae bacterium]|nr:histidinol-phosphatase [Saprospiraceae bacterium]